MMKDQFYAVPRPFKKKRLFAFALYLMTGVLASIYVHAETKVALALVNSEGSVEFVDPDKATDLFPENFDANDIKNFNAATPTQKNGFSYSIDDEYTKKVRASFFQYVTGTNAKRATQISFTKRVVLKDGHLHGVYLFTSPYANANNAEFMVKLSSGNLKLLNTRDSVMGDDSVFDNTPRTDSFYRLSQADDEFIAQTESRGVTRLNSHFISLLTIISYLGGNDIHREDLDSRRELLAPMLANIYKTVVGASGEAVTPEGAMTTELTIDQYKAVNAHLIKQIRGFFSLSQQDFERLKTLTLTNPGVVTNQADPYFIVKTG